ncbi:MAG: hypothetical protein LAO78_04100 [Acidobacteriia bacterium]|nr:hypothetical protein [Terriglobia bacterium]
MLPLFPAHLFARLAAVTNDVSRDMLLFNTQRYNEVARWLREMEQGCVNVGLARTAKQIRAVIDACDGKCPPARFQALVKPITGLLVEELAEFAFLAIPRNRMGFFQMPTGKKRKATGADEAIWEFHAARRCLGLGEPTACVLHLVRVIDFGAKTAAMSLGINIQGLTIGAIAAEIQNSVRSLTKAGTCSAEVEQFYNALVTDLRAFARAYRNPAVHGFQNFTDQQANNLVITVSDFMGHLVANFGDLQNPTLPKLALAAKAP